MLIFMSGFSSRFLGPRAAGMVLAGRILSGSGRVRGAPDSGRVLDVPLSGRAGVPGPVFVCVFQNGWFRAPSRSYLLYRNIPGTGKKTPGGAVPVGVFLPVRLCGRGRRFDVALARQLATTS